MDQSSSGEELVIKTRKPYTITKQRERWTEEEHNKFLEAIKLYGRSWQRIEEHIGTKTAVQIRSHAQKFFSKLEKEALAKGVPVGQALDIDIPPPRPKRKPSNPYPRKSSVVVPMSQVGEKDGENLISASSHCKQGLRLEKEPLPESSEVFITFQEHRCSSAHSANLNFTRAHVGLNGPCTSKEMPSQKEKNQERGTNEVPSFEISMPLDEKSDRDKKEDDFTGAVATEKIPASNNPRNVPDNIVYRSLDASTETPLADTSCKGPLLKPASNGHGYPNLLMNPSASTNTSNPNDAPRSIYHSLSVLSPFIAANHNRDDYHKFLDMSSTFSSLVVSSLLQNPAAHAAASFAASFWPLANLDHSSGSPGCTQCGYLPTQMEYPPSMASIAAATVAAATAWWAAHGLLPLCTPLHSVLGCSPAPAVPSTDTGHARSSKTGRIDNTSQNFTLQDQPLNEQCEALQALQLASKSHTVTSKGSEEDGSVNRDGREKVAIPEKDLAATELQVSDKAKAGKQVERSSSGSNTPSGSEVEADAQKKYGKEYTREPEHDYTNGEPCYHCKSLANINESWKKVSEEGKLAFRELFSRDVLPQSFSSAHDQRNAGLGKKTDDDTQKAGKMSSDAKLLNLNSKTNGFSDCKQAVGKETKHDDGNRESGLMTIGLANGKLKKCWTGFKPYKRCSVEAKESRPKVTSTQGVEKGPKRTRLEEEAST